MRQSRAAPRVPETDSLLTQRGKTSYRPAMRGTDPPERARWRLPDPRVTLDACARPLSLAPGARRIVSLAPSCTDSLLAIGAGPRLVGVEEHAELPPELAHVERIGGFKHHAIDRIAALAPDLVVAAALHAVTSAPALEARGVRVCVTRPRTVDEVVDDMAKLAALVGIARAAAPYLATCRGRVAAVVGRTVARRHRPLVYVELSPRRHTGGPQSFVHDVVAKAGGVSLGSVARVEWPVLAEDVVRRLDPDVIVIASWPGSATPDTLAARDGWDRLAAVKSGRVVALPAPLLKRPGPGLIEGVERLAGILMGL